MTSKMTEKQLKKGIVFMKIMVAIVIIIEVIFLTSVA